MYYLKSALRRSHIQLPDSISEISAQNTLYESLLLANNIIRLNCMPYFEYQSQVGSCFLHCIHPIFPFYEYVNWFEKVPSIILSMWLLCTYQSKKFPFLLSAMHDFLPLNAYSNLIYSLIRRQPEYIIFHGSSRMCNYKQKTLMQIFAYYSY